MPADASIYSMIRPQATVRLQDPLEAQAKRMQIQQLMGQQEMQALQLGEARSGIERNRRIQDLFSTNPNATPDQIAPIDYRAAQKLREDQLKAEKERGGIDKTKAETLKINTGVLRDQAVGIADQGAWDMWRDNVAKSLGPDVARTIPQQFTPEAKMGVIQTADKMLEAIQKTLDRGVTTRGQDLTDARTRAEGAANRGVTIRGQNMTDSRARELAAATREAAASGRIPPGYRMKADGNLEAIPGGPADEKSGEKGRKDAARREGAVSRADLVIDKIDEALKQTGFTTTGLTGATTGRIPGTPAYDLKKTIDTIKANIGFQELQAMREASPTGGALGQVAVQELNMLQAVVSSLDEGQSEDQLKKNLAQARTHFENWKNIVSGKTTESKPKKPEERRTIGNKKYVKVNGEWFEEN